MDKHINVMKQIKLLMLMVIKEYCIVQRIMIHFVKEWMNVQINVIKKEFVLINKY